MAIGIGGMMAICLIGIAMIIGGGVSVYAGSKIKNRIAMVFVVFVAACVAVLGIFVVKTGWEYVTMMQQTLVNSLFG